MQMNATATDAMTQSTNEGRGCALRRYRPGMRVGLALLALPALTIGVWALIAPHGFYDTFPGGGRNWVAALGPYNEHLVRDFAALNLALGGLLVFGMLTLDRRLVQGGLIAAAVYSAPHLGYHLTEFDKFGTSDNVISTITLALGVIAPLLLLGLTTRARQAPAGPSRKSRDGSPISTPTGRLGSKGGSMVKGANWYTRRNYGREIGITGVIAHSRPNMLGWGMMEWWHERSGAVDEKLKVLAATKAATIIGCQFCIDIATHLGREAGVSEQQLQDFHIYRESSAFSPLEKLVMEYGEEMSQSHVNVSDEMFARLREHFDDEQLVELTAAIAIENFRARFNNALDIPPAGFSEGAFCPAPERVQAAVGAGPGAA